MRKILLFLLLFTPFVTLAQFTPAVNQPIKDNTYLAQLKAQQPGAAHKANGLPVSCTGDTLRYARFKAQTLTAISISDGYSVGQFYECPDSISLSGLTMYAWMTMGTSAVVDVNCEIYLAGQDSLPSGNALVSETIQIDSSFGGGVLTALEKKVAFTKTLTLTQPYIIVVSSSDTNRVGVVSNQWTTNDGAGENLMCGTVSGTWFRGLNLNIGGNHLDCDIALEPWVTYNLYSDFEFDDCFDFRDSVHFVNTSSQFMQSKMYNRWAQSNLVRLNFLWNYGHNTGNYYGENGGIKYANAKDYQVRMITRHLPVSNSEYCIDTVIKSVHYQPDDVFINGAPSVCNGSDAGYQGISNAPVSWYQDTTKSPFLTDSLYFKKAINLNDTFYAQAQTAHCKTDYKQQTVRVIEIPSITGIKDDSVCTQSIANLEATSDFGTVRWYTDSTQKHIDTGTVFSTGILNSQTTYFVKAFNEFCASEFFIPVTAYVSSGFAPTPPNFTADTAICLLDQNMVLSASQSGSQQIRWFTSSQGGTPINTGNVYTFLPNNRGNYTFYLDVFDGQCASSRLPMNITVNHFAPYTFSNSEEGCKGTIKPLEFNLPHGEMDWYTVDESALLFSGNDLLLPLQNDTQFVLKPREGKCSDTTAHLFTVLAIDADKPALTKDSISSCSDFTIEINAAVNMGKVYWYADPNLLVLVDSGEAQQIKVSSGLQALYLVNRYKGCVSEVQTLKIQGLPRPSAAYDFQVNNPGDILFSAKASGQKSYLWDFGDGTTSNYATISKQYDKNGEYDVTLQVEGNNGCKDTSSRLIKVSGLTDGIADLQRLNLKIYPNPVQDALMIAHASDDQKLTVKVINGMGQLMYTTELKFGNNTLTTQAWPAGVYHLQFINTDGDIQGTFRVLKM